MLRGKERKTKEGGETRESIGGKEGDKEKRVVKEGKIDRKGKENGIRKERKTKEWMVKEKKKLI